MNYNARTVFLFLLALMLSALFFSVIQPYLTALVLALIFVVLANPLYLWLINKSGGREKPAAGLTVLCTLLLIILPTLVFLSVLIVEAAQVSNNASDWMEAQLAEPEGLQERAHRLPLLNKLQLPHQETLLENAGKLVTTSGAAIASHVANGIQIGIDFFLTFFIMLYAMYFFLLNGKQAYNRIIQQLPLDKGDADTLGHTFSSVSRATVKGTFLIGIVQGGLAGLSFAVVGIDGALFWASVMALLSVIPGIGTPLVWIPVVIYLSITGQTVEAIGVGLWCGIVVGSIDNVLRPILVGRDTEMPDILVLLTTLGGIVVFGPSGIVIGPIIGALCITVWNLWVSSSEEQTTEDIR